MGFLHTLSKLVMEERTITPQQKEKQENHYRSEVNEYSNIEDIEGLVKVKAIEMDQLHSIGSHIIRKMTIHVKHYKLGNISGTEMNDAFIEANYTLKEQLENSTNTYKVLKKEERISIVQIYYKKLDMLKIEMILT